MSALVEAVFAEDVGVKLLEFLLQDGESFFRVAFPEIFPIILFCSPVELLPRGLQGGGNSGLLQNPPSQTVEGRTLGIFTKDLQ